MSNFGFSQLVKVTLSPEKMSLEALALLPFDLCLSDWPLAYLSVYQVYFPMLYSSLKTPGTSNLT